MVELFVFIVAGAACLAGATGVLASRNPVHAALSLVGTLFGIAVLFVAQEAHFLAAVQVIVYAGAIVVLFLFVIMFLGVDEAENLRAEPLGGGQRPLAVAVAGGVVVLVLTALANVGFGATGTPSTLAELPGEDSAPGVSILGEALLTDYVFAFEVTSVLLTIAVVGAVLLARQRIRRDQEIVDPGQEDRVTAIEEQIHRAETATDVGGDIADGTGENGADGVDDAAAADDEAAKVED